MRKFTVVLCILFWPLVAAAETKECGDVVGGGNGVTASDALAVLKKAVGLQPDFECDYCTGFSASTSTSLPTSTTTTSSLPTSLCPSSTPLTDLREDCSGRVYLYTSAVEVAGLITTGAEIGILIADGSPEILLLVGEVNGRRTFSYADVCLVDSGGDVIDCIAISRENGEINSTGSRLTLRASGNTFVYSFDSVSIAKRMTSMASELASREQAGNEVDSKNGVGSLIDSLRKSVGLSGVKK